MKYISGKFSASKVRLAEATPKPPRPERLRLRSTCDTNNGPTVMVLRQPRGPSDNAVVRYSVLPIFRLLIYYSIYRASS